MTVDEVPREFHILRCNRVSDDERRPCGDLLVAEARVEIPGIVFDVALYDRGHGVFEVRPRAIRDSRGRWCRTLQLNRGLQLLLLDALRAHLQIGRVAVDC